MTAVIRIRSELKKCIQLFSSQENNIFEIECESNMLEWNVKFTPNNSGEDGVFKNSYNLKIIIPENYPFNSPKITFIDKVFHPNIDYTTGHICLGILNEWSSKYTMKNILDSLISIFNEPNLDSPVNAEAASLWSNKTQYLNRIKNL